MTNDKNDPAGKDAPLEEKVNEDVGGVQGSPEPDTDGEEAQTQASAVAPGSPAGQSPPDQPAPDAGEIEWAGQVVKKPPHPGS